MTEYATSSTLRFRGTCIRGVESIAKLGFTFVEIIFPCPTNYGRRNHPRERLDELRYYAEKSIIRHKADPKGANLYPGSEILVGKFVEQIYPTFLEVHEERILKKNSESRGLEG